MTNDSQAPFPDCPFRVGDLVRISVFPDAQLTTPEVRTRYRAAMNHVLRVDDIGRKGDLVWVMLNINDDGSQGDEGSMYSLCVPPDEFSLVQAGDQT